MPLPVADGNLPKFGFSRATPVVLALWLLTTLAHGAQPPARAPLYWYRGNLHTHSFWSDGDDFPESITDWYKTNGYHFLAISDHNVVIHGAPARHRKSVSIHNATRRRALDKYRARFGTNWVQERPGTNGPLVRLRTLDEFRGMFEERGRFLLITSEEISADHKKLPLHINATNIRKVIKPLDGTNVLDVLQRNVHAIREQGRFLNVPILPHINHPNFGWAITAEDLMQVRGEKFFEVYNGHPSVRNEGNAHHVSVERMWDIMLAFRLSSLRLGPFYGLAVDDAHNYHAFVRSNSNPGRGWVVVRAPRLTPATIIAGLEAGDFYASTGVRLKDLQRAPREIALEIAGEPGVNYTTQFIGTLRGFDPTSRETPRPTNITHALTRVYSDQIGVVLGEVPGLRARYRLHGDELYVRAKVTSTKPKANPYAEGETEAAWVQPVVPARPN